MDCGAASPFCCSATRLACDPRKSGGVTISHLRFGPKPIHAPYNVRSANYLAVHKSSYVTSYDMTRYLKPNGVCVINCSWTPAELEQPPRSNYKAVSLAGSELLVFAVVLLHRALSIEASTREDAPRPCREAGQALRHRCHADRSKGGPGQAHQHDHAIRLLQAQRCHAVRGGHRDAQATGPANGMSFFFLRISMGTPVFLAQAQVEELV